MSNESPRSPGLMRRRATDRVQFLERCGGGCRRRPDKKPPENCGDSQKGSNCHMPRAKLRVCTQPYYRGLGKAEDGLDNCDQQQCSGRAPNPGSHFIGAHCLHRRRSRSFIFANQMWLAVANSWQSFSAALAIRIRRHKDGSTVGTMCQVHRLLQNRCTCNLPVADGRFGQLEPLKSRQPALNS